MQATKTIDKETRLWGLVLQHDVFTVIMKNLEKIRQELLAFRFIRQQLMRIQKLEQVLDLITADGLTRWVNAWTRSLQTDVDTYIGLYMGASGCAISLLRLYAAQKGIDVTPIFEYAF